MKNRFQQKHTYNYNQNQNHFEEPYFWCHFGVINWDFNLFKITCIHFKFKRDFRILLSWKFGQIFGLSLIGQLMGPKGGESENSSKISKNYFRKITHRNEPLNWDHFVSSVSNPFFLELCCLVELKIRPRFFIFKLQKKIVSSVVVKYTVTSINRSNHWNI